MGGICSGEERAGAYSNGTGKYTSPEPAEEESLVTTFPLGHELDASLACCCAGSDGGLFFTGSRTGTIARHEQCGAKAAPFPAGHTRTVNDVAYCPQADLLATTSRDRSVKVWGSASSSAPLAPACSLAGHELTVTAAAWFSSGSKLASGSRDCAVKVWDVERATATHTAKMSRNIVTCMAMFPGSSTAGPALLAQGAEDLRVRLWDCRQGSLRAKPAHTLDGYVYFPLAVDVSEDGQFLLTASRGVDGVGCEARVWDVRVPGRPLLEAAGGYAAAGGGAAAEAPAAPRQLQAYEGHEQDAAACCFLPRAVAARAGSSSPLFATASKDRTVRLWSQDSGACLAEHVAPAAGAFTGACALQGGEDGDLVCTSMDGGVHLFRVRDGAEAGMVLVAESSGSGGVGAVSVRASGGGGNGGPAGAKASNQEGFAAFDQE